MKIFYGINNYLVNVTDICLSKLKHNNIITIPCNDGQRAKYFTDHLPGILKSIFILNSDDNLIEYDSSLQIKIDILNNIITTISQTDINNKLAKIHSNIKIKHGYLHEELPEQKMVVRYLNGNEKVLEIGGNIGRNSLVIANILENSKNLVTLESDISIAKLLTENRDLNNLKFHIESSALSNRKMIQKSWDTKHSEILEDGFFWVNTIKLDELKSKYNIEFDTLVLDCEGAFYYILVDMPEILNGINLIIMENDYHEICKKNYVDEVLIKNNFYIDYVEGGGWGCCENNFFEVWKKKVN